jgi:hypothetical protein
VASSLVSPCVLPTGWLVCAKGEMSTGGGRVGGCSRVHLIAKRSLELGRRGGRTKSRSSTTYTAARRIMRAHDREWLILSQIFCHRIFFF